MHKTHFTSVVQMHFSFRFDFAKREEETPYLMGIIGFLLDLGIQ